MPWQNSIVRVWDGLPNENGRFAGTAFFVNSDTLLTARHVVENCDNDIYIEGAPGGGKDKIEEININLSDRDIAILQTSRVFPGVVPLRICHKKIECEQEVTLAGYFDENQSLSILKSVITGHVSTINTWRTQGKISRGMSGGPVVLNSENLLIGLIQARDPDRNLTYLIPTDVISGFLEQSGIKEIMSTGVPLYNVPTLPTYFIPRDEHLNPIRELLLQSQIRNVGITSVSQTVGLLGMGGIGKSVLALAIAYDKQIQNAFSGGILWIKLGQTADIVNTQVCILESIGKSVSTPETLEQGKSIISKLLANKKILMILDDVWDITHAEAFDTLSLSSKMLITTRHAKVLKGFDADEYKIDVLSPEQAFHLLCKQSECPKEVIPEEACEIIKECGHLPLAISMIGAMLRNRPRNRWQQVLKNLQNADLQIIHQPLRNYEHANLFKAIHVSVEYQPTIIQQCYVSMAVFPEGIPIPESVLEIYWHKEDLQHYDALYIIDELIDASLLFRYDENRVTLHDLQRDYLRCQSANLKKLHEKLINAYEKTYPGGWHTMPVDGPNYFQDNIDFHLKQIEDKDKDKAQSIAEDLLNRLPLLSWNNAVKYAKLTNKTKKQLAGELIKKNKVPYTLATCLKVLGYEAKEDARRLLKEYTHPALIIACLKLLGEEAQDKAKSLLLKKNQNKYVIIACLKLLGEEAKEEARSLLLKEHQNKDVIVSCLQLLGNEAKEEARSLLIKKYQHPDVIIACLQLLGEEAKEEAVSLLIDEHVHPYVIVSCLQLLGEEAKEEARSLLLKEHQNKDVIVSCLQLLGEEAREEARNLLIYEDTNLHVIIACLQLLGEEASKYAFEKMKDKNWHKLDLSLKGAILKVPLKKPIRQKRALEVLSEWYCYHRSLVFAALIVFDECPEKVKVNCQDIIERWELEIAYCIKKRIPKYSYHIIKALRHPELYNIAKNASIKMLSKEKRHPGFLDEGLKDLAQKLSNGEKVSWDKDIDESVD